MSSKYILIVVVVEFFDDLPVESEEDRTDLRESLDKLEVGAWHVVGVVSELVDQSVAASVLICE